MSTRIIWDGNEQVAALYDSVTGTAFGQVFEGEESYEDAERFLAWLREDASRYGPAGLVEKRRRFAEMQEAAHEPETIPVRKDAA